MSTPTTPIPRLITPDDLPTAPCWLWAPKSGKWYPLEDGEMPRNNGTWTHWLSMSDLRPTQPPLTPPLSPANSDIEPKPQGDDWERAYSIVNRSHGQKAYSYYAANGIALGRKLEREKQADLIAGLRAQLAVAEGNANVLREEREKQACLITRVRLERDHARWELKDAQDRLIRAGVSSPRPDPKGAVRVVVHPWKTEEVPLGAWFRRKGGTSGHAQALISIATDCVHLAYGTIAGGTSAHNTCVNNDRLSHDWEVTTDGGKTWNPAGRLSQEQEPSL